MSKETYANQTRPAKETCKRDLQKRPTKRPTKEPYKRALQKSPTKEPYKRDLITSKKTCERWREKKCAIEL